MFDLLVESLIEQYLALVEVLKDYDDKVVWQLADVGYGTLELAGEQLKLLFKQDFLAHPDKPLNFYRTFSFFFVNLFDLKKLHDFKGP